MGGSAVEKGIVVEPRYERLELPVNRQSYSLAAV